MTLHQFPWYQTRHGKLWSCTFFGLDIHLQFIPKFFIYHRNFPLMIGNRKCFLFSNGYIIPLGTREAFFHSLRDHSTEATWVGPGDWISNIPVMFWYCYWILYAVWVSASIICGWDVRNKNAPLSRSLVHYWAVQVKPDQHPLQQNDDCLAMTCKIN